MPDQKPSVTTEFEIIHKDLSEVGHRFADLFHRAKNIGNKLFDESGAITEEKGKQETPINPGIIKNFKIAISDFNSLASAFEKELSKIEKYI